AAAAQLHRAAPHPLRTPRVRAALPAPGRTASRGGTFGSRLPGAHGIHCEREGAVEQRLEVSMNRTMFRVVRPR
ncbi:hypothetical protein, partial [Pseudonocardia hispaniensis]